jgi:hypothetical protein
MAWKMWVSGEPNDVMEKKLLWLAAEIYMPWQAPYGRYYVKVVNNLIRS